MRKASFNYKLIVINDKFIGVSLGYDFTAEHEWGIEDMKRICGIPAATKKSMGLKSRSITICPPLVFMEETVKKNKCAILFTGDRYYTQDQNERHLPHDLSGYVSSLENEAKYAKERPDWKPDHGIDLVTAWDGGSFGVGVVGEKQVEYLKELHQAFIDKNITIATTNLANPFAGRSLNLLITDRIPKETSMQMYYADKEYFDREDYEKKIGMKKVIEKHRGREYHSLHWYMACSPKWIDYEDKENREKRKAEMNTKYDIIYWINYSDDDSNYGYYSVEEIRQWMKGSKKLTEIRKAH